MGARRFKEGVGTVAFSVAFVLIFRLLVSLSRVLTTFVTTCNNSIYIGVNYIHTSRRKTKSHDGTI